MPSRSLPVDAAADGEGAQAAARGGHVHPRARHREPGGRVVGPDRADRQDVGAVPTGERNLVDGLIPAVAQDPTPALPAAATTTTSEPAASRNAA